MHKNIKILLGASIMLHSGMNLLAPIYAIYITDIGGTLVDAGIAVGIYALLQGVMYFVLDKVNNERVSKKLMIAVGYLLTGICYLLYLFAEIPAHVFIIQAILSIGQAIINPSWSAVIASALEKGKERHTYSQFYGYRALFEGVAAIIGAISATKFGFNAVFGTMAGLAISASILSLFINEEKENQHEI